MRRFLAAFLIAASSAAAQQPTPAQTSAAESLIDAALRDSAAWKRLAELTDKFGPRFSGTANLEHAIHAAEVGDQPARLRDGIAFEAGARAARGHGDAGANGQLDDRRDFLRGRRPRDDVRQRGR